MQLEVEEAKTRLPAQQDQVAEQHALERPDRRLVIAGFILISEIGRRHREIIGLGEEVLEQGVRLGPQIRVGKDGRVGTRRADAESCEHHDGKKPP